MRRGRAGDNLNQIGVREGTSERHIREGDWVPKSNRTALFLLVERVSRLNHGVA